MGNVYLVRTPWEDRPVAALKRMHNEDPLLEERFRHEAALTVRLDHPNLIATYDVGAVGEELYVCSELILGKDLGAITATLSRLGRGCTAAMACGVMCDVLGALSYIHSAQDIDGSALNLIHRDIKPANIIVGYDGLARVADFGAAKSLLTQGMQLTAPGTLVATPTSIAPELLRGEPAGPASDIYSLGSSIYRLLTGVPPHPGKSVKQVLMSVLLETPKPLSAFRPDLPQWLVELIHQMLIKEPESRPQDATRILHHIVECAKATGVTLSHQLTGRWLATTFGSEYASEIAERDRVATLGREAIEELEQETRVFASSPNLVVSRPRSDMFEIRTDVGMPRLDMPAAISDEVGDFEVETKVDKLPGGGRPTSSGAPARVNVGRRIEDEAHPFSDRTVRDMRENRSAPIDPASPLSGLFQMSGGYAQRLGPETGPPTVPVEVPAMRKAAPVTLDLHPEGEPARPQFAEPLVDDLLPPIVHKRPSEVSGDVVPEADQSMPMDSAAIAGLVPPPRPDLASLIPPVASISDVVVQPVLSQSGIVQPPAPAVPDFAAQLSQQPTIPAPAAEPRGHRLRRMLRAAGIVAVALAIGFAIGSLVQYRRGTSIERAGELAALSVELRHIREILRSSAKRGETVPQDSWMLLDATWAALQDGKVDEASRLLRELEAKLPANEVAP